MLHPEVIVQHITNAQVPRANGNFKNVEPVPCLISTHKSAAAHQVNLVSVCFNQSILLLLLTLQELATNQFALAEQMEFTKTQRMPADVHTPVTLVN